MELEYGKIVIQRNLKENSRSLAWSELGDTRGYLISILIAMGFGTDRTIDWLNFLTVYKDELTYENVSSVFMPAVIFNVDESYSNLPVATLLSVPGGGAQQNEPPVASTSASTP
ncbi:hypothetical protein O181_106089 [Austropuccinia psidii MF-1]|uniref:Uncharacterized protein n=1 Tax=Austropuccinia psidii MF-1 TaxID=1389203 RepID=A0A9Q3PLQ4_9BASI|nr:hypothetical protein [Austropuccinia psidii MF-1]